MNYLLVCDGVGALYVIHVHCSP